MGPFPSSFVNQYILFTIDYVSKWIEAIAFPTNDARMVVKFLKKNIFTRFRTPRAIISDGGSTFATANLKPNKYGVKYHVDTPYHLQIVAKWRFSNRELKRILEKTVNNSIKDWAFKLDDAL